ncbi:MAG: hypothetical protein L6Q97_15260 [Thermoanaerobaculia bacterium]|nr:hypothetical protein [Thermoanaerobaculia bacterium]
MRFLPDTYQLETLPGNSQFGHTFDPWAHQLVNENARPLRASNVSVMPERLENSVSVEQMRDLLAFLKKGR